MKEYFGGAQKAVPVLVPCALWTTKSSQAGRINIIIHQMKPKQSTLEKIVDSMKDKVRTTAQPIPAVYNEEIQAVACRSDRNEVVAKLPTFSSLKTSLYRQRRLLLPPLPKTRADVHFDGKEVSAL